MNIIQALNDQQLFRPFLDDDLATWGRWMTALRAVYGLPVDDPDVITECTGRDASQLPSEGFSTALFLTGRRSGKSRTAAIVGAYEAVLAGREKRLSKGERGIVLITAPTKSQGRIVRDYVRAIFETPLLAREIESETKEGFELRSGTRIEILAGDWRTIRGYTLLAAIVDEVAFFGYDSESKVRSDSELIRAIAPSLATSGGKLIAISSPYARKGWTYSTYKRHHGNDNGSTLVWNCPSRTMNPTLPQRIVDEALAEDLASARAEYLGMFRDDVQTFLPRDIVENCVVKGRIQLSPQTPFQYFGFVDLSGGRVDDAALAIGHPFGRKVVVDFIRRWKPPFNPNRVIGEMVDELHRYGIRRVIGDNYSAEFVKSGFESYGVRYERSSSNPWSKSPIAKVAKPKSQLYLELLPRLTSGEIELLDNELLIDQLAGLERRTRSGGRDTVDHGPGQHDDIANVVAGVTDCCVQRKPFAGVSTDYAKDPLALLEKNIQRHIRNVELFAQEQANGKESYFEQSSPAVIHELNHEEF